MQNALKLASAVALSTLLAHGGAIAEETRLDLSGKINASRQGMDTARFKEATARQASIDYYKRWYKDEYAKKGYAISDQVAQQLAEKALADSLAKMGSR